MTEKRRIITPPPDDFDIDTPLTDEEIARGLTAMLARNARAATGLSQTAFARRYNIPVGCIRDWEQGRCMPDKATQSYLKAIHRIPDAIASALQAA